MLNYYFDFMELMRYHLIYVFIIPTTNYTVDCAFFDTVTLILPLVERVELPPVLVSSGNLNTRRRIMDLHRRAHFSLHVNEMNMTGPCNELRMMKTYQRSGMPV